MERRERQRRKEKGSVAEQLLSSYTVYSILRTPKRDFEVSLLCHDYVLTLPSTIEDAIKKL